MLLALALAMMPVLPARAQQGPVIAAAASLQGVAKALADDFAAASGQEVRIAFGSTGNLARQIREGAPFELFMAADDATPLALAAEGLTRDAGRIYAIGRLALAVPEGSPLAPDGTLEALAMLLAEGRLQRFAIASPEHAPYGMRAEEALRHAGLWEAIQPHLVLGENVAQAAQFALSGNAEGGIIALSLAVSPELAGRGHFAPIPVEWHRPLAQRMVLLAGAGPVAQSFGDYLVTPRAGAILARYGFSLPD